MPELSVEKDASYYYSFRQHHQRAWYRKLVIRSLATVLPQPVIPRGSNRRRYHHKSGTFSEIVFGVR
jgi:hypothetical protein